MTTIYLFERYDGTVSM